MEYLISWKYKFEANTPSSRLLYGYKNPIPTSFQTESQSRETKLKSDLSELNEASNDLKVELELKVRDIIIRSLKAH